jgi:GNAT superfamily N-acetyltransferase
MKPSTPGDKLTRMSIASQITIRPATVQDAPLMFQFIRALADYEKLSDSVTGSEELIRKHLFGEKKAAETLIAYLNEEPAGFALYFYKFSTFLTLPGIWLEDLFVYPQYRRNGIGRALLQRVAAIAVQQGCGRLEWTALDWNTLATDFYKKLGAEAIDEWTIYRMTGESILRLSRGSS